MSDELKFHTDNDPEAECGGEEYEEITSEEVDRIVAALDDLMESTDSQNIRAILEEAATSVYCLVYDAEDDEDIADAA